MLTVMGSAGAPAIPGLSGDDLSPPGIIVTGDITGTDIFGAVFSAGGPLGGGAAGVIKALDASGNTVAQFDSIGTMEALGLVIGPGSGANVNAFLTPNDDTHDTLQCLSHDQNTINFRIGNAGGIGLFQQAPPAAQAILATGAGATVDDVIALLQSYGLCKQS